MLSGLPQSGRDQSHAPTASFQIAQPVACLREPTIGVRLQGAELSNLCAANAFPCSLCQEVATNPNKSDKSTTCLYLSSSKLASRLSGGTHCSATWTIHVEALVTCSRRSLRDKRRDTGLYGRVHFYRVRIEVLNDGPSVQEFETDEVRDACSRGMRAIHDLLGHVLVRFSDDLAPSFPNSENELPHCNPDRHLRLRGITCDAAAALPPRDRHAKKNQPEMWFGFMSDDGSEGHSLRRAWRRCSVALHAHVVARLRPRTRSLSSRSSIELHEVIFELLASSGGSRRTHPTILRIRSGAEGADGATRLNTLRDRPRASADDQARVAGSAINRFRVSPMPQGINTLHGHSLRSMSSDVTMLTTRLPAASALQRQPAWLDFRIRYQCIPIRARSYRSTRHRIGRRSRPRFQAHTLVVLRPGNG